ncbi:hypothetical protein BGW80DRAFT_1459363 [Lactifluus volemus]|nr:hypothetical protein BGW80DRAFT_1459363 [Lactifluus volemus]
MSRQSTSRRPAQLNTAPAESPHRPPQHATPPHSIDSSSDASPVAYVSDPSHETLYNHPPSVPSAVLPRARAEHPYALPFCRPSPTHTDYLPPSGPFPGLSPPHSPTPYMGQAHLQHYTEPSAEPLPASSSTLQGTILP